MITCCQFKVKVRTSLFFGIDKRHSGLFNQELTFLRKAPETPNSIETALKAVFISNGSELNN